MKVNILSVCASFVVFTTVFTTPVKSQFTNSQFQSINTVEPNERMGVLWGNALENVRIKYGISTKEFDVFQRFETNPIHILKGEAMREAAKENFDPALLSANAVEVEKNLELLYEKFLNTEKLYPSSVDEYRHHPPIGANPCDSSGCTNIGFDQGTLNTWYGYYAENTSTGAATIISGVTGGLLGAVTEACNDPNVITYEAGCSRTLANDYQLSITSSGYDRLVPTIPRVSPWSTSGHSVMLGDSTLIGSGAAILSKTFLVTAATSDFTYQYAVFLANPPHPATEQPFFNVYVLDENGDTIPNCGSYNVVSGVTTIGFDTIPSYAECGESFPVFYKNWTLVNVPLKNYIGQCVTVEFEVADCEPGGHFGYAYIDCSCSPFGVISSSPNICGQDSISLTAPPGSQIYAWTGPTNGILSDTAQQTVWVDSAGVYTVITIPVTGASCADTISITVGRSPGPPPTPSFTTTTACAGQAIHFTNTSTDTATANFYWDFYNIGIYQDTNVVNPTWTYSSPGTYTVVLQEIYNGCGKDTSVVIVVDSTVAGGFTLSGSQCVGSTLFTINSSTGATSYSWNFGDSTGGTNDTVSSANASYTYTMTGTYTITLISKNSGPCPDTSRQTVIINTYPKPVISGLDSVCPGYGDTLKVTGGNSPYTYSWSTGATTSTIIVSTTSTQTITVTASNGSCSHDTTFVIHRVSPIPTITPSRNPTCPNDTLTLRGTGLSGSTFLWSTGTSSASIVVHPSTTTTYTLYETLGACTDSSTIIINIISSTTDTLTKSIDSVCPGTTVTLSATASGGSSSYSYSWNNGGTTSSINVTDTVTTTYTATISGACNSVTKTITNVVIPLPKPIISGTPWKCHFIKDTLTVTSSTNPTTYLWSNGSTKTSYYTGPIDADSIVYVIATNSLGCSDTAYFTITSRAVPLIIVTKPKAVCSGEPVTITASATGTGPFTYSWAPGGETTDSISVASPADSTTYVYTVTVSNGCPTTKTIAITAEFPYMNTISTQTISIGSDTVLWANGNSTKYDWQDSTLVTCLDPPKCDSVKVTPTVTTTYSVTGTDKAGCTVTGYVTINVDVPCLNFIVPNVFTPNYPGPTGNDNVFYIKTEHLSSWSIIILDRWGKEMYNSTNQFQYWTGTNESGSQAPDGVYYYIITAVSGGNTCPSTTYKKEGFVQMIR